MRVQERQRSGRGWTETSFAAIVADWDGTIVPDRRSPAPEAAAAIAELVEFGVHIVIVSGTHLGNVAPHVPSRLDGPGSLHLCCNRGSEVFRIGPGGVAQVVRRVATEVEERALDRAAAMTAVALSQLGLDPRIVSGRLNRRKIDLLPTAEWADPPKARIGELVAAMRRRLDAAGVTGLAPVVDLALQAARRAGLVDPRVTSDVKHVEIGLTDKSDSARWAEAYLRERGITGELVALLGDEFGSLGGVPGSDQLMRVPGWCRSPAWSVGVEPEGCPDDVEHLGGGPVVAAELLARQVERRRAGRVPSIDHDPAWVVRRTVDRGNDATAASVTALGNGRCGVRGGREEAAGAFPAFVVNGVYTPSPSSARLLPGPLWDRLDIVAPAPEATTPETTLELDLRTGVLVREGPGDVRTLRFVSASDPELAGLRAEGAAGSIGPGPALRPPDDDTPFEVLCDDSHVVGRTGTDGAAITVAVRRRERTDGPCATFERLAVWSTDDPPSASHVAVERVDAAHRRGFEPLLTAHRAAWAARWADADVTIVGDDRSQLAARFAVFHLLAAARGGGETAIGARGMTGAAYGGHVFWDADAFVVPALCAIDPAAARAALEYRVRRADAARRIARERGLDGARFPWESAGDGTDVTPTSGRSVDGVTVPIRTGALEEHIVADVAWAAMRYVDWTGDRAFADGPGRMLLCDTARYWAGRVEIDADGSGHLRNVMGPDEYHEIVDDNAFTNAMARWNLHRAAAAVGDDDTQTAASWRTLAAAIVDGYDDRRGLHEQFAGYWQLEPLVAADVRRPPFAADLVLGRHRCSHSQLIKQADVVMAHHLVPDEMVAGSASRDLDASLARCTHGSSLSPAIHAVALARAGRVDEAFDLFDLAAHLSLDDLAGTTSGGLHLAALGGVWQAIAHGFLGIRVDRGVLEVDPKLPARWESVRLSFRYRGTRLAIRANADGTIDLESDGRVDISAGPHPLRRRPLGGDVA